MVTVEKTDIKRRAHFVNIFGILLILTILFLCSCAPLDFNGYGKLIYKSQIDGIQYVTFSDGENIRTFQLFDKKDYDVLIIGEVYNFSYGVRQGINKVWDIAPTGETELPLKGDSNDNLWKDRD